MKKLLILLLCQSSFAAEINLSFKNLRSNKGLMQIALFNSPENFPNEESGALLKTIVLEETRTAVLSGLSAGDYAIAVYHDENSDYVMNKNSLGIPKEGFGFSNNPRILFGAPKFKKVKFRLKESDTKNIQIKLKHF